ncbi:MAG: PEP-CTERM sorting domain-containing protein [Desulfobacteraceae bacterium]|nr:PEP-CTERM sorting domain-containing protein [Desulfobacteraceae bacterium]
MKHKLLVVFGILLFMVSSTAMVNAAILTIGDTSLSGTTVGAQPNLAGTVVEDELVPFLFTSDTGLVEGNVQSRVVLSIDGTYDFYWRIRDTSGTGKIGSLRIGNFITGVYNADYRIDGVGDVGPDIARLLSTSSGDINFIFSNGLDTRSGEESLFFFFDTDALNYRKTAQFDLTGTGLADISNLFSGFAPAPVPVPGTLLLLGSGILGLIAKRRKKD